MGQRGGLARERPAGNDDVSPELPAFPPARVAGVVAKAHEDRQRDADEREGNGADPRKNTRVLLCGEDRDDADDGNQDEAARDPWQNRAIDRQENVLDAGLRANDHFLRAYSGRVEA